MKKLFIFFTLVALSLSFAGCEKDEDECSDPTLSVNALYIYPGMSYSVPISGGSGSYSIMCNNPEIAGISIDHRSGTLLVKAHPQTIGVGTITLTDNESGKTTDCFLNVNGVNFNSGYSIDAQQYFVDVTGSISTIENDLKSKFFPTGSLLLFSPRPNNDSYGAGYWTVVTTDDYNVIVDTLFRGTFISVPLDMNQLPKAYDALPVTRQIRSGTRYLFDMPDGRHTFDEFYVVSEKSDHALEVILYDDRTEYYQTKYPETTIRTVVNRYRQIYGK